MMRRVLIVSPHFPPDSSAGTHRVRLLAPHLTSYRWQPTILTVDPRYYEGRLDPALADSVPSDLDVVRVGAWSPGFSRRFGIGDLGVRAFGSLHRTAARLLRHRRFDALFITIYPSYPALLGPLLKRRFGIPFVLDYQDPWVGEWGRSVGPGANGVPDLKSRFSRFVSSRLEPLALASADGVTAVSRATYEQALARCPRVRPAVVEELPIGWDPRDLTFLDSHGGPARHIPQDDGLVHVSYVGTLLPTGIDTLRAVLTGLAELRRQTRSATRLRLHFFGTSNLRSAADGRVLPIARSVGVEDLVTEIPERLDYFEAMRVLADSTAVLLMGSREPHYTASKVFPALLSRRPVIAAFHDASTAAALLRRAGRTPTVRLITYDERSPAMDHVGEIRDALAATLCSPLYRADDIDAAELEACSARALAGRLAAVLDRSRGCAA